MRSTRRCHVVVASAASLLAAPLSTVLLVLTACASSRYQLETPKVVAGQDLAPYAIHEECVALVAGERVAYRFTSSAPVAFNVHFHDSNAIVMPITRDQVMEDSDDFTADRKQTYCLMWEAGAEGALIDYRVGKMRPAQ